MANPEWTAPLDWEDRVPSPVADALMAVVDAMRDYIVPGGISGDALAERVIGACDNPEINPFIQEIEHGRS